jgi:glycine/D-amino acid oxidase-like deaminating enzyme
MAIIVPNNDQDCGWTTALPPRTPTPALSGDWTTDWVVVGAGYTGLSAARKLAELLPEQRITLVDAQIAGEGASARNSGYLVDSTLNDGHLSDTGLAAYQQKYALNSRAVAIVEDLVKHHGMDVDWDPSGKFHAARGGQYLEKLERFSDTLAQLDIKHQMLNASELQARLGTGYYQHGIHTDGGVMLQPAKLARALLDILPESVSLFENTPVLSWTESGQGYSLKTPQGTITARGILFAVNGFMPALGLKQQRVFPLTLTASLTRPLSDVEYAAIGNPKPWGLLSAQAMGATVRLTEDRRIMIRNTAEVWRPLNMALTPLAQRQALHVTGLQRRFPSLPADMIANTWSGITCISANNANVFEQISGQVFAAGCYNGGGIGLAVMYGESIALKAAGGTSTDIDMIEQRPKPKWLPPSPFLQWGIKFKLAGDRRQAVDER